MDDNISKKSEHEDDDFYSLESNDSCPLINKSSSKSLSSKLTRSKSPSAISLSSVISGMEWDPSADVGTMNHPSPGGSLKNSTSFNKEKNYSSNSNFHSKLLRSLSEESSASNRLNANYESRSKSLDELEVSGTNFGNNVVKMKLKEHDLMKQLKLYEKGQVSSKDSVVTVRDSQNAQNSDSNSNVNSNLKSYENAQRDEKSLKSNEDMKSKNPSSFQNSKTQTSTAKFEEFSRIQRQRELKSFPSSSDELHHQNHPKNIHSVSESSTDWEWSSHSNPSVKIKKSQILNVSDLSNRSSSVSEWQNSGLTRSEIQHKKKMMMSTSESYDSQQIKYASVELELGLRARKNDNPTEKLEKSKKFANSGVQTEDFSFKNKPTSHPSQNLLPNKSKKSEKYNFRDFKSDIDESESGLTPTCSFIRKLVCDERRKSPKKQREVGRVIETHRTTHILQVKKELDRLQKLNSLVNKKTVPLFSTTHSESQTDSNRRRKIPHKNSENYKIPVSFPSKTSQNTQNFKNLHLKMSKSSQNNNSSTSNLNSSSPEPVSLEEKIDELLSAFHDIVNVLGSNSTQNIASTQNLQNNNIENKNCDVKGKKLKKIKNPVSFFVPLAKDEEPIWIRSNTKKHEENKENKVKKMTSFSSTDVSKSYANLEEESSISGDFCYNEDFAALDLQQVLHQFHPTFVERVRERQEILKRIKEERKEISEAKREWVLHFGGERLSSMERNLPPRGARFMSSREMREQTRKKYNTLPEVQDKKLQIKAEKEKYTNMLMSNLFAHTYLRPTLSTCSLKKNTQLCVKRFSTLQTIQTEEMKILKKKVKKMETENGDKIADGSGTILDKTETNLVALRRTIYLTIQSSLDYEECCHKLLKMNLKEGQEVELCHMIVDCCAQQRTYEKFFGLIAVRFCAINRIYTTPIENIFKYI